MKLNEFFNTDRLPDVVVGSLLDFNLLSRWKSDNSYDVGPQTKHDFGNVIHEFVLPDTTVYIKVRYIGGSEGQVVRIAYTGSPTAFRVFDVRWGGEIFRPVCFLTLGVQIIGGDDETIKSLECEKDAIVIVCPDKIIAKGNGVTILEKSCKVQLMNINQGWNIYRYNNLRELVNGLRW